MPCIQICGGASKHKSGIPVTEQYQPTQSLKTSEWLEKGDYFVTVVDLLAPAAAEQLVSRNGNSLCLGFSDGKAVVADLVFAIWVGLETLLAIIQKDFLLNSMNMSLVQLPGLEPFKGFERLKEWGSPTWSRVRHPISQSSEQLRSKVIYHLNRVHNRSHSLSYLSLPEKAELTTMISGRGILKMSSPSLISSLAIKPRPALGIRLCTISIAFLTSTRSGIEHFSS